ncbi:MAG: alpha-amylase family glycosyl hydrolase [Candidatus Sericytochromatia bacterium]|nr:alpha-amylase family glycosyl hydrolase [Candidatus Sericytochromatia bacterium]
MRNAMGAKTWGSACLVASLALTGCGAVLGAAQSQTKRSGLVQQAQRRGPAIKRQGFTPKWVKDAVFYQIFPERFANGSRANDPAGAQPWGGKPEYENFFGGDLAGVKAKIPYLKSLGINAVYFNPLFKASSNHKYNTADYMQIDPAFGTNADFKATLDALHAAGIRVLLDGVFNHTGDDHPFFLDCKQNGPQSPYWSYYSIWGFPVVTSPKPNYNAWWGFGTLPQLTAARNRKVQEYLFDVTEYWTRQGIDGWRLDVPNEIDNADFWREWRRRVRAINPEAYIVGEIWEDGSQWLQGDQFDAVMNYVGRSAILDFFAYRKSSVDDLDARQSSLRRHYGQEVTEASFNILGSHDVARVRTEAGGDLVRTKEALLYMFTQPGAPVIYYGDEIGMLGGKDPDNRRCFPWEEANEGNDMLRFVKRLVALRKSNPALRGGEVRTLMRHNHYRQFVFARADQGQQVVVAMNSGDETRDLAFSVGQIYPEGTRLRDLLSRRTVTVVGGSVRLDKLEAHQTAILAPETR